MRQPVGEAIPSRVVEDVAFRNARRNSDEENARIEHGKSQLWVMTSGMKDDAELFKQLMDNAGSTRWMSDTVYELAGAQVALWVQVENNVEAALYTSGPARVSESEDGRLSLCHREEATHFIAISYSCICNLFPSSDPSFVIRCPRALKTLCGRREIVDRRDDHALIRRYGAPSPPPPVSPNDDRASASDAYAWPADRGTREPNRRAGRSCSATDSVHQHAVRSGGMRRSPADLTSRALVAFCRLQHIRFVRWAGLRVKKWVIWSRQNGNLS